MRRPSLDWTNTLFLGVSHALAVLGVLWLIFQFHWETAVLGLVYMALCGLAITGGYHRLFSHPTYKGVAPLRAMYLFFGAASVQNSALKWSADHRRHHTRVDSSDDPYDIRRGFWWAHIGWVLHRDPKEDERDPCDSMQMEILIASPGGIFGAYPLRSVQEYERFYAFGSGAEYAIGAMHTVYERAETPEHVAVRGIEAAAAFDDSTALPYTLRSLTLAPTT